MSEDLCYTPATELLRLYRNQELSPVEVTRAVLDRIAAVNPKINAYCLVDETQALAQARAAERRWLAGQPLGRLDGVPASVKDLIVTKGWPTLRGSRTIDPAGPWNDDAPAVARLKEHGAVLLGKTTTPEFGWKGVTDSALTGATHNPWKIGRTPGGSSGGASAQVAAGLGPLAIGTDGGGSIRIPAAFAGIVGMKPSFGRVPAWPASPFGTVAHLGPMTRTVADAALMLTVLAGPDYRDWLALPASGEDYGQGLDQGIRGLRIAFSPDLGYARVDPEVAAIVAGAVRHFAALGAEVEAADPGFSDVGPIFAVHWQAGAFQALKAIPPEKRALIDEGLLRAAEAGGRYSLSDYLDAAQARAALGLTMRTFHTKYDLLVTPSLAVPAFAVNRLAPPADEGGDWTVWTPFSYPFNLTQQPAISVPCGFTAEGLPVGLQIVGPAHRDALVLRAARAFETACNFHDKRPSLN